MKPLNIISKKEIKEFRNEYFFLSNFYGSPVEYMGIVYPTAEHFYQAFKIIDKTLRLEISKLSTPAEAKKFGNTLELRETWDVIKVSVMETCITMKFDQHPNLKTKLLGTYPRNLIEGNYWHDNFWGDCNCKRCSNIIGENRLGILLMKLRKRWYERTKINFQ